MAHHFQLRFTPAPKNSPALTTYDLSGFCALFEKYVATEELSQDGIRHYHVYVETDVCAKTARNYAVKALSLPKFGRGIANAYYMLKFDAYTDPNPSYVLKEGKLLYQKGYNQTQIEELVERGRNQFLAVASRPPAERSEAEGGAKRQDKSIEDVFDEYVEAVLPKDKKDKFDMYDLRLASRNWWRSRGRLLPAAATYQRFLISAWLEWEDIVQGVKLVVHDEHTHCREDIVSKISKY